MHNMHIEKIDEKIQLQLGLISFCIKKKKGLDRTLIATFHLRCIMAFL